MLIISFLPILIIVIGGYFLMKLRFFFILHPIKTVRKIKKAVSRIRLGVTRIIVIFN